MYVKFKGDHPVYPPKNQDEDIVEQLARGIEYHDPSCENQSDPRRNEYGTLGTIGHTEKCLARFYAAEQLRNLEIDLHNVRVRRAQENDAWHRTMDDVELLRGALLAARPYVPDHHGPITHKIDEALKSMETEHDT